MLASFRYDKYLNPDQPKAKAVPKGDQFQTEFDEIDDATARLAEVRHAASPRSSRPCVQQRCGRSTNK